MSRPAQEGSFTVKGVASALRSLGLGHGDQVMVHSDLRRFGVVRDETGRLALALPPALLYEALREVLGDEGTVVVPTFSYSWTRGEVYNPATSPSFEGSFSEYVRTLPGAKRSPHPLMSVAAVGPAAGVLLDGVDDTSFGEGSPFGRMHRADTKHLTVGVSVCSFSDYVQWACRVPYRYPKRFRGWVETGGAIREDVCEHWVRYLNRGLEPRPLFEVLDHDRQGHFTLTSLAGLPLRLASSRALFHLMRARIDADPYAFSSRPNAESTIDRVAGLLSAGSPHGFRLYAVNQDGIERWVWVVPAWLVRVEASIRDSDGRSLATSAGGALEVFLDSSRGLCVDERLSGADLAGRLVADRGEVTAGRLARSGWLIRLPRGETAPLSVRAVYHVHIEAEARRTGDPDGVARVVVLVTRGKRPGAVEAMDCATQLVGLGEFESQARAFVASLLRGAPIIAALGDGAAAAAIPALAPDLAGGVRSTEPVQPEKVC
jgi:aminoglycoside 3-N-acetyltransferase